MHVVFLLALKVYSQVSAVTLLKHLAHGGFEATVGRVQELMRVPHLHVARRRDYLARVYISSARHCLPAGYIPRLSACVIQAEPESIGS